MRSHGRPLAFRLLAAAFAIALLAAGLFVVDRAAAADAAGRIAARLEHYGFAATPAVTVEGFPFLTQLLSHRLDAVDVAGTLRTSGVTATVHGRGTGILLGSGHRPTTITNVTATGLIPFSGLAVLTHAADVPGLQISAAGPHTVKLRVGLGFLNVTKTASVSEPHAGVLTVRLLSPPSVPSILAHLIPAAVIAHLRLFTIRLPQLPLGLTVSGVTIVRAGALFTVSAHDLKVGTAKS